FEILSSLQKNPRFMQLENLPPLRLAPPAVYHEKRFIDSFSSKIKYIWQGQVK
ncbi:vacuolar protein sorting-associated protein 8-like, partial [Trifolium medium]|nr:vacuolar protein sorting-associated protein 8-like [Trifolium medium]